MYSKVRRGHIKQIEDGPAGEIVKLRKQGAKLIYGL